VVREIAGSAASGCATTTRAKAPGVPLLGLPEGPKLYGSDADATWRDRAGHGTAMRRAASPPSVSACGLRRTEWATGCGVLGWMARALLDGSVQHAA
jgi:hypothetical protein